MPAPHRTLRHPKCALVAGWFSFPDCHATAGDILAAELACDWLEDAGFECDLALDPPFTGGVNWRLVSPKNYSHIIFVCGPFQHGSAIENFMSHFDGLEIIGLNLTMTEPLEKWNPFHHVFLRNNSLAESEEVTTPDITFLSTRPLVPVVGVCLVEPYGAIHENQCFEFISRLLGSHELAVVPIDTRLDKNYTSLASPAEVESVLSRMDVVVTTRLHGTVLSLKNGVPVIALDPGGDSCKIIRLAQTIDWPCAFRGDQLSDKDLHQALEFCLSWRGRLKARECRQHAKDLSEKMHQDFMAILPQEVGKEYPLTQNPRGRSRVGVALQRTLPWKP